MSNGLTWTIIHCISLCGAYYVLTFHPASKHRNEVVMASLRITKTIVDGAKLGSADYFIWDSELKGLGLKVSRGGRKTYVCQYRTAGGRTGDSRRLTIGAHGSPWTVELARAEAKKILGRAANGEDPAQEKQDLKKHLAVTELCDQYLVHGCATKKPRPCGRI
jgi:hypothetical protein